MNEEMIRKVVHDTFYDKEVFKDISEDDDFFDLGVSSLTIVEIQIVVEKALKLSVETSELMRASTLKEWVALYCAKNEEQVAS